ncbi:MAG: aminotransferase class I/II-fold pyridoxal phosphate-dependent enzyme [Oscillospiraceae bacterium]|jgi:histidinol-phosphate/aromatic aminotransferase/cobyric acid decarboxylase-like protein/choline kinase|nr:aminotransferase class I/II-fold pyridoxal phosphate-dependent enzyme [Oscillospiraceae bacterium]
MQGIILAAGMGRRLKELTAENTKCMVAVNGVTLIDRLLHQLQALQLSRVVIVVGYQGQKLKDYIGTLGLRIPIVYIENPIYDTTNNIYSLWLARNYLLKEDTLLLESDIIVEDSVLQMLHDDPRDTLALVDKYESWMDGTVVKLGEDDSIQEFIPGKSFDFHEKDQYYKTVNFYKFGKKFSQKYYVPFLEAYSHALGNNEYYEQVLRVISLIDEPCIRAKCLTGQKWYEIDDMQDLSIASVLFADDDGKVAALQGAYGGFWRFPKLLDFCYLVNPFYPPQKLVDEMQANFQTLLTQYPSGMKVNSLLAAKNFDVKQEYILVGNGASELIKALMGRTAGKIGFVRPTFEEYPNRCKKGQAVVYRPGYPDFSYHAADLIAFFSKNPVNTLLLINPDNPTGNYLPQEEVLQAADWAENAGISLIVDESFVDFADEQDATLFHDELLEKYPHLIVVKSISKSYGVPGVRLGVLASANTELIAALKKDVAIWNINSFGEFYMQIAGKYQKDYTAAMQQFRAARTRFVAGLHQIPYLRVLPTQANYVMCELTGGLTSARLTRELLVRYKLFIKDLSAKVGDGREYIRLAVRDDTDNEILLKALKELQ